MLISADSLHQVYGPGFQSPLVDAVHKLKQAPAAAGCYQRSPHRCQAIHLALYNVHGKVIVGDAEGSAHAAAAGGVRHLGKGKVGQGLQGLRFFMDAESALQMTGVMVGNNRTELITRVIFPELRSQIEIAYQEVRYVRDAVAELFNPVPGVLVSIFEELRVKDL